MDTGASAEVTLAISGAGTCTVTVDQNGTQYFVSGTDAQRVHRRHVTQPVLETEASEGERHYDVFLSYNSVDADAVEQLARRLTGANLTVWFDRWRISAGDDWQDELADGLARSDGCLVFVGPSGIGDWARQELKVALDRSAKRPGYRVVPVLLPGAGVPVRSDGRASTVPAPAQLARPARRHRR